MNLHEHPESGNNICSNALPTAFFAFISCSIKMHETQRVTVTSLAYVSVASNALTYYFTR